MLELRNITKAYKTKSGDVKALNNLSLTFPSTGLVFITGKSGCGKTTLLNVIGGLDDYDSGEILLLGKSFKDFTHDDLNDYRNTFIGFIFQEYNLLTEFTAEKNIEIAMELQGSQTDDEEVDALLRQVEIQGLRKRKPMEISGGQRQRLAIARALVKNPRIIMADEPTGALDSNTGIQVIETLKELSKDKLIIVVSHDQEFAEKYADRIIRLVDGNIAEDVTYTDNVSSANVNVASDKIYVKQGSTLSSDELNTLGEAIKANKKIELIKEDSYREKSDTDQSKIKKAEEKELKMTKSKMKLKSSLAMGVKSLGVKPLRLIFTILLSVIAFGVFGLFDTIASFTTEGVIANLLRQSPSTIALYSTYTPDKTSSVNYQIKISGEKVQSLANEIGTKAKGVYNYKLNSTGKNIDYEMRIEELSGNPIIEGAHYYTTAFNGFVEFNLNEINGKNFKDFDYTIVKGKYPNLQNDEPTDIAISTFLADSLIHYLGESDYRYSTYESMISNEAVVTVEGQPYRIIGIIKCGNFDNKYDALKSLGYISPTYKQLKADFDSYVNAGPYRCIFAADGALALYNEQNNKTDMHFTGEAGWVVKCNDARYNSTYIKTSSDQVLASKKYSEDNIIFFDGDRADASGYTLQEGEVLIHANNLYPLLYKQYSKLNQASRNAILDHLETLSAPGKDTQTYIDTYNALFGSAYRENGVGGQEISLSIDKQVYLDVTKNVGTKDIKKTVSVVGIYFGLNVGRVVVNDPFLFMMNDATMVNFEIHPDQGDYSRILVRPRGRASVTNTIASHMNKEEGYKLVWFKNSALDMVQENENTIRQFSELFLYVALVLALFSIFMLFNYITTSIINKRHSTGILRALGANGKDIFSMFLIESLVIALINGIFAVGLSAVGCTLVNTYIANVMNIGIPFALFGLRQVIVIIGISVLTAVLSSTLPIIKIVKEKPVNLIRRS